MIHAADAARQIVAAADSAPDLPVVALSDARPEGYAWREIVQAAAAAVGRTPAIVRLPDAVFTAAGAIGSLAQACGANPMLTLGKSRELRWRDWSLQAHERWLAAPSPMFKLREGFADTIGWWRATHPSRV